MDRTPLFTVVIIDDHQMVLDGLPAPCCSRTRTRSGSSARPASPRPRWPLATELKPDAVCCSTCGCAGPAGWTCARADPARPPDCKVVFLTVYDDEQYLYQALRVGAAGFLLKRIQGGELVDYLRRICDGRGAHRPQPGRPGGAVRRPAAQRRVLARRAPGPDPAGERGAVAARRRAVQPGHRDEAGGQRGDGEDATPGASTASSGCPTGPARSRSRCARAYFIDRRACGSWGGRGAGSAAAVPGDRHDLGRPGPGPHPAGRGHRWSPRPRIPTCASCTCSTSGPAPCSCAARPRRSTRLVGQRRAGRRRGGGRLGRRARRAGRHRGQQGRGPAVPVHPGAARRGLHLHALGAGGDAARPPGRRAERAYPGAPRIRRGRR